MEHADGGHEGATTDMVVGSLHGHQSQSTVVNGVELARSVRVADVLEKLLYRSSRPWHCKVVLLDTDFGVSGWEE